MRRALPSDVFSHQPVQRSPQLAEVPACLSGSRGRPGVPATSLPAPRAAPSVSSTTSWGLAGLARLWLQCPGLDLTSCHSTWACPLCIAPLPRTAQSSSRLLTGRSGSVDQLVTWLKVSCSHQEGMYEKGTHILLWDAGHPALGRVRGGAAQDSGPGCGEASWGQAWSPARPFSSPPLKGASGSSLSF